jgi:hypothetical protein
MDAKKHSEDWGNNGRVVRRRGLGSGSRREGKDWVGKDEDIRPETYFPQ